MSIEKEKIKILYIDDEENNLVAFRANFRHQYDVYTAISANEGKGILNEINNIHIIVTDQRMPDITGVQFLESIVNEHPDPIRMLLTGYADIEAVIESINKGKVSQYITKPFNFDEMNSVFEEAYNVYSFKKQNQQILNKYKKLFDESSDTFFIVDAKGKLIDFNNSAIELLKYSRNQLNHLDYKELLQDKELKRILNELKTNGYIKNLELRLFDKEKNNVDCLITINCIYNEQNKVVAYQGIIKDITDKKNVNNALVRIMLDSQEKERDAFARDLHDNISQQLASVNFYLQTMQRYANLSDPDFSKKIDQSSQSINKILSEIRDLCYRIMPRTVIGFTLLDAIKDLCIKLKTQEGIDFKVSSDEDFPPLDKNLEITLFRAVQEFIANALNHGKSNNISIRLRFAEKNIIILLQDNGVGFNLGTDSEIKGTGIKNIKSRIESYNGTFQLQSVIGEGTFLKISVPATLQLVGSLH